MNFKIGQKISVQIDLENEDAPPSPTFGTKTTKPQKASLQGMQKVGKHGKSHHQYLQIANKHNPQQEYRKISRQELSKHKSQSSAWLSLNGIVYDVTVYLNFHPGGDILLEGCGKQCDQLFYEYHSWVNGKHLLEKYKIGYL